MATLPGHTRTSITTPKLTPEQIAAASASMNPTSLNLPAGYGLAPNSFQLQGGTQGGSFASEGTNAQQSTQLQGTQGVQNQAQIGTNQGVTTQNQTVGEGITQNTAQTGGQTQQGTSRSVSGVDDTLGFGDLIRSNVGTAQGVDTGRQAYLQDLMANGYGGDLGERVRYATNQALSSPSLVGAGPEAQGRVGGEAVANLIRSETADRLNASGQLAGPTATGNLIQTGLPLLNRTQDTSQNVIDNTFANTAQTQDRNLSTTGTTGTTSVNTNLAENRNQQNTITLQDLLQQTVESGVSAGDFYQEGVGRAPETGGGTVLCTALYTHGLFDLKTLRDECEIVNSNPIRWTQAVLGYRKLCGPLAKKMTENARIAKLMRPIVMAGVRYVFGRSHWFEKPVAFLFYNWFKFTGRRYNKYMSVSTHDSLQQMKG